MSDELILEMNLGSGINDLGALCYRNKRLTDNDKGSYGLFY